MGDNRAQTAPEQGEQTLPEETAALLRTYFDAFNNLYGIVPLYRALRIIRKQNPELVLTEEQFLAFADGIDEEEQHCIVAGPEEIYDDVTEKTPPLKRELICEHLYVVDNFESYEELKTAQAGRPYYIPDREELLKYADSLYIEETPEYLALGAFLRDRLGLECAENVLEDLQLDARMNNTDPELILYTVWRLTRRDCFSTTELLEEFFGRYYAMYWATRTNENCGFTLKELYERGLTRQTPEQLAEERLSSWAADAVHRQGLKRKKPGRNDLCPCGSGKKYKKCCGR